MERRRSRSSGVSTPGEGPVHDHHPDAVAVLQDAELLQALRLLQGSGRQLCEGEEELSPVDVEAEVAVAGGVGVGIAHERDGQAGEVEGEAPAVQHDLDHIGIGQIRDLLDGSRASPSG